MTTVLVVDDIAENRYLLETILRGNGYEVVTATNGAEALAIARAAPPSLVVTDALMPVMDGFDLCRSWRADERLRTIPFVIYTATYTEPSDERFALELGASRFIIKPQKPAVLISLLREVLEQAAETRAEDSDTALSDEMELLRHHNQALFRKLEKKVRQLQSEIEERRRIQAAFEESQQRLFEAHRLASIGIWDWDAGTDTVHWSDELYRIADRDPASSPPSYSDHPKLYAPESWARLHAAVGEALRTGRAYQLELELVRPDGTRRWVTALGGPKFARTGEVTGLHGMVQDITCRKRDEFERQKLESQLRTSQKMEAIGRLAGGVAHDFNNLLVVILGCSEFAVQSAPEGSRLRDDLAEVVKAAERAANLTRQLLAFSRTQVFELKVLDLNLIVEGVKTMLRRLIGEDIDLAMELAPDAGQIRADASQLQQVIMNLVINARDAMPAGGTLTIETAEVELDSHYTAEHVGTAPGQYVLLAISDTGCGMDEATQQRLFEPFFTTKPQGEGTGLGLSTVYGIVRQTGGSIEVYSELGHGTTFKAYFPRVSVTAAPSINHATPERSRTSTDTILVVEDEEAVRRTTVRMLRAAHYQVLSAASGVEAIELSQKYDGPLQLLLTDVVMPRMSGRQVAEKLCAARPGLRVLYMSGYTSSAIVHHGVLEPGMRLLSKPFSAAELTRKIREVLDGAP